MDIFILLLMLQNAVAYLEKLLKDTPKRLTRPIICCCNDLWGGTSFLQGLYFYCNTIILASLWITTASLRFQKKTEKHTFNKYRYFKVFSERCACFFNTHRYAPALRPIRFLSQIQRFKPPTYAGWLCLFFLFSSPYDGYDVPAFLLPSSYDDNYITIMPQLFYDDYGVRILLHIKTIMMSPLFSFDVPTPGWWF